MKSSVSIDQAGRIVLPKPVREELGLSPGDTLDLTITADEVTLRPRRATSNLQKERGTWVLRTGKPLSQSEADEMLRNLRAARDRKTSGQDR